MVKGFKLVCISELEKKDIFSRGGGLGPGRGRNGRDSGCTRRKAGLVSLEKWTEATSLMNFLKACAF
jgi:hypothetical protein